MSKRLQVLLPEREMEELRRIARRRKVTVGAWVRQALRAACSQESTKDPALKLKAVREAVQSSFPTGDIKQMLAEIERGYLEG